MNGPYIITTMLDLRSPRPDSGLVLSRRAVATLEDDDPLTRDKWGARRFAGSIVNDAREQAPDASNDETYERLEAECWALPESGGTVGPLPDGTVIEVEAVTWQDIAREGGLSYADAMSFAVDADKGSEAAQRILLDAYNAKQEQRP